MSAKTPILITVPHYVNLGSPNPMFKDYVECKQQSDVCKGRKRRLDHLTWEEKLQRKKLKNRVAAQTSRDRKKSRMDDMEATINDLRNCNEKLKSECKMLRMSNKKLLNENCELRKVAVSQFSDCCTQNSIVDSTLSIGSTVSLHPLPQGKSVESATVLKRQQTILVILKMLLTCLLSSSPTSTHISTLTNWRSSLKAYSKISPQTWSCLLKKDRLQRIISKKIIQEKWWGRHQSTWNPVEVPA